MNKKENPGVSRCGAAMLLLFSLAVSVLLGFAMPVHAADDGRTTPRTLRVGFYPYTGYMTTAADGSRSGYAYELLQDIAQHENVTFTYSCLDGNTQQAMQQLAAGRCSHPQAVCRYLAPELHGFVQQLAVTRQEGLGHLAVCME